MSSLRQQLQNLKIEPFPECKVIEDSTSILVTKETTDISILNIYPANREAPFSSTPAVPLFPPSSEQQYHVPTTNYVLPQLSDPLTNTSNQEESSNHPKRDLNSKSEDRHGDGQQQPPANMALQFMQAVQQSVNQVADIPFFGYKQVKPDYRFDSIIGDDEVLDMLNSIESQTRTHDMESISDNIPGVESVTPQTMEEQELYKSLEVLFAD